VKPKLTVLIDHLCSDAVAIILSCCFRNETLAEERTGKDDKGPIRREKAAALLTNEQTYIDVVLAERFKVHDILTATALLIDNALRSSGSRGSAAAGLIVTGSCSNKHGGFTLVPLE
jgi:hypothetical protein